MAQREGLFGENAIEILVYLLATPVFIGPAILAMQGIEWLKTGHWPPVPLSAALDYFGVAYPSTDWVGAQKAINFVLDFPLSVVSFVFWMIVIIFVVSALEESRLRRQLKNNRYTPSQQYRGDGMTSYMLDTNLFNDALDGKISVGEFSTLHLLVTHIQRDELSATKNAARAAELYKVFDEIRPDQILTRSAVWDVSRFDQASYSSADGVLEKMLERLRELDAMAGKKARDPANQHRDVLIADGGEEFTDAR